MIGWISPTGTRKPCFCKKLNKRKDKIKKEKNIYTLVNEFKLSRYKTYIDGLLSFSEVDRLATREKKEVIKQSEDLAARLMDRGDDGSAISSKILDSLNDEERGGAVEAGGGLVEEEDTRAYEDLEGNAEAFLLAAADASELPVSDLAIGAFLEAHLHDGGLYDVLDLVFIHGGGEPQMSGVMDGLSHCQSPQQHIFLRNVSLINHPCITNYSLLLTVTDYILYMYTHTHTVAVVG